MNLWGKIHSGLSKTREGLKRRIPLALIGGREIGPELLESIEEALIQADLGAPTTHELIEKLGRDLKSAADFRPPIDWSQVRDWLKRELLNLFPHDHLEIPAHKLPYSILVVGVNGVGKTTSIGKLAALFRGSGKKVLLAAADTFRAAAIGQLEIWAGRTGSDFIAQQTGSDPSAVVFDALTAARSRGIDVVLVDTAGRLHTKINLMEEVKKIKRVMGKAVPGSPHEIWLVLDATTGQNAIAQGRIFQEAIGLTGVVMTKLDGTARGGTLAAIANELKIPVRYVGVGEAPEDLLEFDPCAYVEGLLD